jgi:hypothetical protein
VTDAMIDLSDDEDLVSAAEAGPQPGPRTGQRAQQVLEASLALTRAELVELRRNRDHINDEIRVRVADEEDLVSALRPFQRRANRTPQENHDA